jgi:hypothetical protein
VSPDNEKIDFTKWHELAEEPNVQFAIPNAETGNLIGIKRID